MYRNFGNQGRGNSSFANSDTGSPHAGSSSVSLGTASTSTTQQEQKFSMAGSNPFVPSLNAITTNQDLQWLVQPSFGSQPGPSQPQAPRPTYQAHSGIRPVGQRQSQTHYYRPGVIRAASHSTRRRNDEHLSAEEMERRRIRRERNKLAAAKCRNRRRELTDTLQTETDELELEKSHLQKEIAELQKKKEKLELVLEAHRPICKIEDSSSDSDSQPPLSLLRGIKMEPESSEILKAIPSKPQTANKPMKPKPKINIPAKSVTSLASAVSAPESDSLHTPVLMSTPSFTPFTANLVFTYPSAPLDAIASVTSHAASSSTSSHHGNTQQSLTAQHCGIAHRRSSSSGDQSDHSLHSPTILSL